MSTLPLKKLPSADWIAFGVGVAAMALHYVYPPLLSLVAFAVFAPSILRELGVLNDADELARQIMHRAGFHSALMACALIFLNHLAPALGFQTNEITGHHLLGGEIMRKGVVWVFVVSYLIQYWGAREGVYRMLLVVALMTMASLVGFLSGPGNERLLFASVTIGISLAIALLGLLVRRWPRTGGGVLSVIFIGFLALSLINIRDPKMTVGMVSTLIQTAMIFGVTGMALLRESR